MARLWNIKDVAEFLDVPVNTIYQWRVRKYGPPARRIGKYLRYKPDDVKEWFDSLGEQIA